VTSLTSKSFAYFFKLPGVEKVNFTSVRGHTENLDVFSTDERKFLENSYCDVLKTLKHHMFEAVQVDFTVTSQITSRFCSVMK
jgi:hypothetical protein